MVRFVGYVKQSILVALALSATACTNGVPVTTLINSLMGTDISVVADATNDAQFTFYNMKATSYECQMDGGGYAPCTSPFIQGFLATSLFHTFEVRGLDASSNIVSSSSIIGCKGGEYNNAGSCTPCSTGSYQDSFGRNSCITATAGNFVAFSGQKAQTPAAMGKFAAGTGNTTDTNCIAGEYQPSAGQSSCIPAPAGSKAPGTGNVNFTQCIGGQYQASTGQASCNMAAIGSYATGPGATTDTPCSPGSYTSTMGNASCTPAAAGKYATGPGATTDTSCLAGSYTSTTGNSSCTLASAGYAVPGTGATTETACVVGTYSPSTGASNCTNAGTGEYVGTGTATAPTACTNMPSKAATVTYAASSALTTNTCPISFVNTCTTGYSPNAAVCEGVPDHFVIIAGDGQTASAGTFVATAAKVELRNVVNDPMPGFTINFVPLTGGGNVTSSSPTTDAFGQAQTNWLMGPSAGPNTMRASYGAFNIDFSATATTAPASTDQGFNYVVGQGASADVYKLAYHTGTNRLYIAGAFASYTDNGGSHSVNRLAAINPSTGQWDPSFNVGTGFDGNVYAIFVQSDGKVIVGGDFFTYNGFSQTRIARLNTDGSVDFSFNTGTGFNALVRDIKVTSAGNIVVAGEFITYNGNPAKRGMIMDTSGNFLNNADLSGYNNRANAIWISSTDDIYFAGSFDTCGGNFGFYNLCKWDAFLSGINGTFTSSYGIGTDGEITSITGLPTAEIILGGYFNSITGNTASRIAVIDQDGIFNYTFTSNGPGGFMGGHVGSIDVDLTRNKIILSGGFTMYDSNARYYFARLNMDGSLDGTFNTGGTNHTDTAVHVVLAQPGGGGYFLGGNFREWNAVDISPNFVMKVNP